MGQNDRSSFRERRASRSGEKSVEAANWGDVNAEDLVHAVAWTAACGGALRLGYTRDGGAYAIGVYLDGNAETEYVRPSEDINQWLRDLADDMRAEHSAQKR